MPQEPDRPAETRERTLQARMEYLRARLNAAKIAYLNSTPFEGRAVTYEDLNRLAREFIQTSYEYQKLRYGAVKVKISVAKLLRRGG